MASNYRPYPVDQDPSALARAAADLGIGSGTGTDPGHVATLAVDPQTRNGALRHVISAVVFRSLMADASNPASMLPVSVAEFLREMPPVEQYSGNANGKILLS